MGASAPSRISAADATAGKQVKLELGVLLGNTEYQVLVTCISPGL